MYAPPPRQPAVSYTPTSKVAIHMQAPQPLYSNTANRMPSHQIVQGQQQLSYHPASANSQPVYSNQQQQPQQALYTNISPAQHGHRPMGPNQQQLYVETNSRNRGELDIVEGYEQLQLYAETNSRNRGELVIVEVYEQLQLYFETNSKNRGKCSDLISNYSCEGTHDLRR